ncbi:UDP-glucose dehydrogenase family protein [Cohnella luojiensis]|uniref:UDP-glucose 6-dehydrogenase n=1 Tax=Cohnella luojiensis TaxID=652876 RepID=A0A4Y8LRJ0_9BACL|nr:UDP-glucose/GDP-mannose dehydrogenase family protein [Cohnella luojiensis]TFE22637.1 UDP-glucose/GDP-mannose dehydrogenase family protein [Cohnella luojiensis]
MKVAVVGTGYVGLATGISLAYLGHKVTCIDIAVDKIESLRQGKLPIFEPGLEELFLKAKQNLHFTTSFTQGLEQSNVIFLAVGTPANSDGSSNLTYLFSAVDETIAYLSYHKWPTVLVNKSTAPVGTSDLIVERVEAACIQHVVTVASNPEFLSQGKVVNDTLYPERIVIGGDDRAIRVLQELYSPIISQSFASPEQTPRPKHLKGVPIISVDTRSAELAKYAANAFLAMKISFINEIANLCDLVGADVTKVAAVIGKDSRIGSSFLQAGIGYGGSCFPKDTLALQFISNTIGYDFKLLSSVISVNNSQKFIIIEKLREELGPLYGKKIAVLGLTFKPGTDDIREAPSIPIIHSLLSGGAEVYVHDPVALDKARASLPSTVHFMNQLSDALIDADGALLITEWPEYLEIDAEYLSSVMRRPLFIDGRNAMDTSSWRGIIEYRGVGISNNENKRINSNVLQSK